MPCHEFLVIPFHGGWIVQHDHDRLGPYQSEPTALQVALAEALQLRERGMRTKASVKDCAGNTRAEYCLCKEFRIALI